MSGSKSTVRSSSPQDGYLSLRLGEPMEEVNFIDQVRLVAVDHPAEHRGLSRRALSRTIRLLLRAKTIFTEQAHPVAAAWDDNGRDVTARCSRKIDHQYVRDFTNLPFCRLRQPHTLTLDMGPTSPANPLRLLMHGFIEYFSASSMYAAWQAGLAPIPPYVEAQLPDGSWKRIVDDMGFPAGLPRTIVIDLTGSMPAGATPHPHHHKSADLLGPGSSRNEPDTPSS